MAISEIIAICTGSLTLLSTLWGILASKSSSNKTKLLGVVLSVPKLVFEAEKQFGRGNGVKKIQWVLDQVKMQCLETGLTVSKDFVTELVKAIMKAPQDKESQNELLKYLCGIDTVSEKQIEEMKTIVQSENEEMKGVEANGN